MRQVLMTLALLGSGAIGSACAPQANDTELKAMCDTLVRLRGEVDTKTLEERTAQVNEDFAKREKLHEEQQAAALRNAEADTQSRLDEAGDDAAAKESIAKESGERRATLEQEGAEAAKEIAADKAAALAEAKSRSEAAQAELAEAITSCVADSKQEGVSQGVAVCRAEAESTDAYWNQCR